MARIRQRQILKNFEGVPMASMEKEKGRPLWRRRIGQRKPASVALRMQVQTSDEQRQFQAAFRTFLTQMSRQMLDSIEEK
jgi:hypothetical protein